MLLFALIFIVASLPSAAQKLNYPATKKTDQTDTYFGVKVADPYRWLEDDNSPETARWVEEENKVTFAYLENIPYRKKLKAPTLNWWVRCSPSTKPGASDPATSRAGACRLWCCRSAMAKMAA